MKAILDHVGIAVKNLDEALAFYRDALGLHIEVPEEVASQRVRAHFIATGQSTLELLEPTSNDSVIARYVEKRGPGLHHVTLRVDDISAALAQLMCALGYETTKSEMQMRLERTFDVGARAVVHD